MESRRSRMQLWAGCSGDCCCRGCKGGATGGGEENQQSLKQSYEEKCGQQELAGCSGGGWFRVARWAVLWTRLLDISVSTVLSYFFLHHPLFPGTPSSAGCSRNRHLVRPFSMQRGDAVLRAWALTATVDSRCFVGVVTVKPLHFPATVNTCYPFLFVSIWLLEWASGRRERSETELAQTKATSWQVCCFWLE